MFDRYVLNACFKDADEMISIAKMKNHAFMGITLTVKNLFGLPPMIPPQGRTRAYYHHFIRLSHLLPDLAMITQPCLNIVDALTGQWGREWGWSGTRLQRTPGRGPLGCNRCVRHAPDGADPGSDWPVPPFRRDRNHLLIAAERGFGTVDLDEIDFVRIVHKISHATFYISFLGTAT